MKNLLLRRQLRRQGATSQDAKLLSSIADTLSVITPSGLSSSAKKQIAADLGFTSRRHIATPKLAFASLAAVFAILIVLAQGAQPGSVLYALKRGSEEVRTVVQPGFNQEDLQQRRDDEQRKAAETQKQEDSQGKQADTEGSSDDTRSGRQSGAENTQQTIEGGTSQKSGEQQTDNSGSGSSGTGNQLKTDDSSGSGGSGISGGSHDSGSGSRDD